MVPGMKEFDYPSRLKTLKLWSLEERRNRSDLIEVSRCTVMVSHLFCLKLFSSWIMTAVPGDTQPSSRSIDATQN